MNQHTVLIADSSEDFCCELQDILRWSCCVRTCSSGGKALRMISDLHPDILVLDLMLPELDGISLLKALTASGSRPVILASTYLLSDYIVETARKLQVDYLMVKPCDLHATAARVQEQLDSLDASADDPEDVRFRISGLLMMMGFSAKLNGFRYLKEAIFRMLLNPNQSITKELYPAVGELMDAGGALVERSIRAAVSDAWKRRDDRIWQLYFPPDSGGKIARPTNAVFISRIADGIRIGSSLSSANRLNFIPAESAPGFSLAPCKSL